MAKITGESSVMTSIRIRPQTRKQLEDLRQYGNNSIIFMIALDRMWHEEQTRTLPAPTPHIPPPTTE